MTTPQKINRLIAISRYKISLQFKTERIATSMKNLDAEAASILKSISKRDKELYAEKLSKVKL